MAGIAEDVVSYELGGELQYVGKSAVREVCAAGLSGDDATFSSPDLTVLSHGDLAVAWGLDQIGSSRSRATRIFKRDEDGWKLVHQHLSLPH